MGSQGAENQRLMSLSAPPPPIIALPAPEALPALPAPPSDEGMVVDPEAGKDHAKKSTTYNRPLATMTQEHCPVDMTANNKNNLKQWTYYWRWQRYQCKAPKKYTWKTTRSR